MNVFDSDWHTLDWLNDARRLIRWTRKQNNNNPLMLVVRHSHREDSTDVQKLLKKRLTELGHQMAFCFGKELPSNRILKIFYSSHPRCHETAQEISKGFVSVGGTASLVSDIRILLGPQGSGDIIGNEMLSLGGPEFVRRWTVGKLSKEAIEPIKNFGAVFVKETLGRLHGSTVDSLHIHVTHDLVLMGARNILFGTIPNNENWTPYLGGFGIVLADDVIHAFEGGRKLTLGIVALLESFSSSEKSL